MDETYLLRAVRYVLLNPVRAGLADRPEEWPHSSIRTHTRCESDPIVAPDPLASRIDDWDTFLDQALGDDTLGAIRKHSSTGRPLGSESFRRRVDATTRVHAGIQTSGHSDAAQKPEIGSRI